MRSVSEYEVNLTWVLQLQSPLSVAFACLFLLIACAGQKTAQIQPDPKRAYPAEIYLIGEGAGGTFDEALDRALAQIARQIEVTVTSEVNSVISTIAVDDRESIEANYRAAVKTVSTQNLQGAEVIERREEGGQFRVICALDKAQFAAGLAFELEHLRSEIFNLTAKADSLAAEGKVLAAIEQLVTVTDEAVSFETRAGLWSALTGRRYEPNGVMSGAALIARAKGLADDIVLKTISGDDQIARLGDWLPEPLLLQALYPGDEGAPVGGLKLILMDDRGTVIERTKTDARGGGASFRAKALSKPHGTYRVRAEHQGPPLTARIIGSKEIIFRYQCAQQPPPIVWVKVFNAAGERLSVPETLLMRAVESAGGKVSQFAAAQLVGRVRTAGSRTVDGTGGRRHLVRLEMDVQLVTKEKGDLIGQITVSAEGMDVTKAGAEHRALENLTVPRNDLVGLLGKLAE